MEAGRSCVTGTCHRLAATCHAYLGGPCLHYNRTIILLSLAFRDEFQLYAWSICGFAGLLCGDLPITTSWRAGGGVHWCWLAADERVLIAHQPGPAWPGRRSMAAARVVASSGNQHLHSLCLLQFAAGAAHSAIAAIE